MQTQISAETITPIIHGDFPVITTEFLASLYGTDPHSITKNHRSNVDRFVAGKHFFKLEGADLKAFKNKVTNSDLVASRAKHLILWTERGAARHAKMLETDQAWEVFEKLEDCYFSQKQPATTRQVETAVDMLNIDILIQIRDGNVKDIRQIGPDMFIGKVDQILSGLRESGWIVIKRDLLAKKLATW
ncbi:ORF6N domain-containing protein [Salmonella enterica subsp. enterica serovar Sandiego]|nr:ORF6N domain-containing protein [Salmonella enterica]EDX8171825.1 ORF6N domain-containing protein [Salmonella enterica subsp. enterica serovar Sandiego]EFR3657902.1 ORF6N domain-containing protein [Salmonella enterica]EKO8779501.1 ORF6N domain-containing protein [Salmonella enterica]EKP7890004.1 ORF6N domain-containing protein [Salmonella enterica]